MEIKVENLQIDKYRQGDHRVGNVRITHKPTGHVAEAPWGEGYDDTSELQARETAMKVLRKMVGAKEIKTDQDADNRAFRKARTDLVTAYEESAAQIENAVANDERPEVQRDLAITAFCLAGAVEDGPSPSDQIRMSKDEFKGYYDRLSEALANQDIPSARRQVSDVVSDLSYFLEEDDD